MKVYHIYVAGKHKLDRIDFFLAERRSDEELRQVLHHLGLGQIRQLIRSKTLSLKEAEHLCIIASKLLKHSEVQALHAYIEQWMGIPSEQIYCREVEPPLDKMALQDEGLRLAIQEYHQDGLFLALWGNPGYDLPVKIGGFVVKEAQSILEARVAQIDQHFATFVQAADTIDDLLGGSNK